MDPRTLAILWQLLAAVHRRPDAAARHVLGDLVAHRFANRLLREHDTDPSLPAVEVHIGQWTRLAAALAANRAIPTPRLPRGLRE